MLVCVGEGFETGLRIKHSSKNKQADKQDFSDMMIFPGINIKGSQQVLQSRCPDLEEYIHEQEKG